MTSRERVGKAIRHEEADRVPLDLGGTIVSGIMAHALGHLRRHLRLEGEPVKVNEVFQMLGEVDMDVVDRLAIDVLPVEPLELYFGLRRERFKPWTLWDGSSVLMPGQFNVDVDSAGNWLLHTGGDPGKPVEGRMPRDGFYFDRVSLIEMVKDYEPPAIREIKKENRLTAEELEYMQQRAEMLFADTDKALVLGCWNKTGLPWVGSIPDFLMLMLTDKAYVKDLFEVRTETAIENLEMLNNYLGDKISIICLDGTDYGSQRGELFSPEIFEEVYMPFMKLQTKWIHDRSDWKILQHSCGSITQMIPLMIKSGIDILNPVQTSAKSMDPVWLKQNFGDRLVFWGGGVDTQKTLPFGSARDVEKEVEEQVGIFAPGGGYVFGAIHNIQQGTPPENIVAAYNAALKAGSYPIK